MNDTHRHIQTDLHTERTHTYTKRVRKRETIETEKKKPTKMLSFICKYNKGTRKSAKSKKSCWEKRKKRNKSIERQSERHNSHYKHSIRSCCFFSVSCSFCVVSLRTNLNNVHLCILCRRGERAKCESVCTSAVVCTLFLPAWSENL